jgi:hypothetical protein
MSHGKTLFGGTVATSVSEWFIAHSLTLVATGQVQISFQGSVRIGLMEERPLCRPLIL